MAVGRPLHLLSVWNPAYSGDALDVHLALLLEWSRRAAAGEAEPDEVYVWWGKIRSRNRTGRLKHHDQVTALDAQARAGVQTHLYLTDYRSLYVAEVGEITDDDVREDDGERDHVPAYYEGHACDFWFRLFDVRRLVSDDTPAVIEEAAKLRNVGYHDRPVSLYGGMVDLPLLVHRDAEAAWFSDRDALTEGGLWAQRAAELRSDTERMSRELRDNLFGRDLWSAMEPATRTFLASAEAVFRARRDDPGFDLSGVAVEYAKAVETELNALVFPALRRAMKSRGPAERETHVDGRRLDLGGAVPHQTLGAIRTLLAQEGPAQAAIRQQMPHDHSWILGILPRELEKLVELRNAGAHSEGVAAETLGPIREMVLGVGREGMVGRLVRARVRGR
ncbi:MAG TPA: hypothetical protein VLH75_06140 [Longimicrobiales bacterium]|nr:hypothetical protein [Longimicrobiales bacterium]